MLSLCVKMPRINQLQPNASMVSHQVQMFNFDIKAVPYGPADMWQDDPWQHILNVRKLSFARSQKRKAAKDVEDELCCAMENVSLGTSVVCMFKKMCLEDKTPSLVYVTPPDQPMVVHPKVL